MLYFLLLVLNNGTIIVMKRKHRKTLELIFAQPTSANIDWKDIEAFIIISIIITI